MHLSQPHQGYTEKLPPPFSIAYTMVHPVLEAQMVCHIIPSCDIVVIINHVEPQIINLNKYLLSLNPYFPFLVVHMIF